MTATTMLSALMDLAIEKHCNGDSQIRICVGNYLYDINHINTSIDIDSNKPNIVIYVKEQ